MSVLFLIFALLVIFSLFIKFDFSQKEVKTKVAICPTYYYLENILIENDYDVIKTDTSAESFSLLANETVNLILSGRIAQPGEGQFEFMVVGEVGYSFLSHESLIIYNNQFSDLMFFTDLDSEKIKQEFSIKNITEVDNVYDYLGQGILITSWENTDLDLAQIVHVMKNQNVREPLSRRLNIFYPDRNKIKAQQLFNII